MTCFKGFMELKDNFTYLNIINCKPNEPEKYVLEADPEFVQKSRITEHSARVKLLKKIK